MSDTYSVANIDIESVFICMIVLLGSLSFIVCCSRLCSDINAHDRYVYRCPKHQAQFLGPVRNVHKEAIKCVHGNKKESGSVRVRRRRIRRGLCDNSKVIDNITKGLGK